MPVEEEGEQHQQEEEEEEDIMDAGAIDDPEGKKGRTQWGPLPHLARRLPPPHQCPPVSLCR